MKSLILLPCLALVVGVLGLGSCTLFVNDGLLADPELPGTTELQDFQRTYMASFEVAAGRNVASGRSLSPFGASASTQSSGARATVPIFGATAITLPTSGSVVGSKADYPEPGQVSSWTITPYGLANVYQVAVVTTFPAYDTRESQTETYLISSSDGVWTTADIVVDNTGAANDKYRVGNRLTYRDGSYQDEVITSVKKPTTAGNMQPGFAAWDVAAALDYPALFTPVIDTTATYSSTVAYTRNFTDAPSYTFWAGERGQAIVGVRYYTEHISGNQLIADMVLFEKAVNTYQTTSGSFVNAASALFLPAVGANPNPTLLAQSFLRQRVTYAWDAINQVATYSSAVRDTRIKTTVVNISAQKDYYITRINGEAAQLVNGDTSITIPSGDATEILAIDSAAAVNVKLNNLTVQTGDLQPVAITTNTPTGDLGTLYTSIAAGAVTKIISNDVPTDLTGTDNVKQFEGQQGITIDSVPTFPAAYNNSSDVSERGTVQAWIYINSRTDTAGIVHCGSRTDFLDEVWSLQFMGSSGQVGFALSTNDGLWTPFPTYNYDWVGSSKNLNTKRWYYLVATWDRTLAGASFIKFYINGVLDRTGSLPNATKAGAAFGIRNPDVLVGSQFYGQVLPGYYGFNGKINGVNVETTVQTAAEILAFYNANKSKTSGW